MKIKNYECPKGNLHSFIFKTGQDIPKIFLEKCKCENRKRKKCEYRLSFRQSFIIQSGYRDDSGVYFPASSSPLKQRPDDIWDDKGFA